MSNAEPNAEFVGKHAEATGEESDMILTKQRSQLYVLKQVEKGLIEKTGGDGDDDEEDGSGEKKESSTSSSSSKQAATSDKPVEKEPQWVTIGKGDLHVNLIPATSSDVKPKARMIL